MRHVSEVEWNQWYNAIYGYVYRRVSVTTAVEEITTNVLEDFFMQDTGTIMRDEKSYIFGIARNKVLYWIRSKYRTVNTVELDESWDTAKDEHSIEYKTRMNLLMECAKNKLSLDEFTLVELSVLYDYSSPEVAQKLNLTAATVRQRLSRTLKKLRTLCTKAWN
jgi:RNA polymerase sigma factor (sigma-70 family)